MNTKPGPAARRPTWRTADSAGDARGGIACPVGAAPAAAPSPSRRTKAPPGPFVVAVDQREQRPFAFDGLATPDGRPVATVRALLPTGDYAIEADLDALGAIVERKAATDLLGCIGRSRERFEAELSRLDAYAAPAVVVETQLDALLRDCGGLAPSSVVGTLVAWQQRFRAAWLFAPSRGAAERLALRWLCRFALDVAEGRRPPPAKIIVEDAA